ncbi:hypothetical protein KAZ57_00965 [Patescibacteria group bacterium]|nr:hypothetical protein [Patescibacteria group bacterium]
MVAPAAFISTEYPSRVEATASKFSEALAKKNSEASHGNSEFKIAGWSKSVDKIAPGMREALLREPTLEGFVALSEHLQGEYVPSMVHRAVVARGIQIEQAFPEALETAFVIRTRLLDEMFSASEAPLSSAAKEAMSLAHLNLSRAEISAGLIRTNIFENKASIYRLSNRILAASVDMATRQGPEGSNTNYVALFERSMSINASIVSSMEMGFKNYASGKRVEDLDYNNPRGDKYFAEKWNEKVQYYKRRYDGTVVGTRNEALSRWALDDFITTLPGDLFITKADTATDLDGIGDFFVCSNTANGPEVKIVVETKTDPASYEPSVAVTFKKADGSLGRYGNLSFTREIPAAVKNYVEAVESLPVMSLRLPSKWSETPLTMQGVRGKKVVSVVTHLINKYDIPALEVLNG